MPRVLGLKNNTLLQDIKTLLDKLEGGICVDVLEFVWYVDDDEVCWNSDNNKEALYNQDGSTYSCYIGSQFVQEGLSFLTVEDGCGGEHTAIFRNDLKVSYEDLEEEFG